MFDGLQKFIERLFCKRISELEDHILVYKEMIKRAREDSSNPRKVVEKVLGRGIKWFVHQDMSKESRRNYYNEAQQILNSTAFNNIINYLIATQCQEQIKQYNPELHLNPIRDTQMMINAWELLREELESITDPEKDPPVKLQEDFDPYALT